eukprot:g5717.t1
MMRFFFLLLLLLLQEQLFCVFGIHFWAAQERFLTEQQYHEVVGFEHQRNLEHLSFRDVFFVISTWYSERDAARLAKSAWLENLWQVAFITDKKNDLFPAHQQDDFPPSEYPTIYEGKFVLWMRNTQLPENVRWVVFLPSVDAFVHLGHLYYFLKTHTPKVEHQTTAAADDEGVGGQHRAVMFANYAPNTKVFDYDLLPCSPVILNRLAWDRMVAEITKRECPFVESNSLSLGFCSSTQGVTAVHTDALSCNPLPSWHDGLDFVAFLGLSQMEKRFDKSAVQVVDPGFPTKCMDGWGEGAEAGNLPGEGSAEPRLQTRGYFSAWSTIPNLRSLVEGFCWQAETPKGGGSAPENFYEHDVKMKNEQGEGARTEDLIFDSSEPEKLRQYFQQGSSADEADRILISTARTEQKLLAELRAATRDGKVGAGPSLQAGVVSYRPSGGRGSGGDGKRRPRWLFWVQEGLEHMYVNFQELDYFLRQFEANYDSSKEKLILGSVTEDNHILALNGLLLSPGVVHGIVAASSPNSAGSSFSLLETALMDPGAVIVHSSKFVRYQERLPKTIYGTIATPFSVFTVQKLQQTMIFDLEEKAREHDWWFRYARQSWEKAPFFKTEGKMTESSSLARRTASAVDETETGTSSSGVERRTALATSYFTPERIGSNSTTGIRYIHGQNHIGITKSGKAGLREFRKHQVLFRSAVGFPIQLSNSTTVICDKTTIAEDITQLEVEEI